MSEPRQTGHPPNDTATVHGHQADPGCWVNSAWGQYGPEQLADRADEFGWQPATCLDDPRQLRVILDHIDETGYTRNIDSDAVGIQISFQECVIDAMDAIEHWLNEGTADGYAWGWDDGEFFLRSTDEWEDE